MLKASPNDRNFIMITFVLVVMLGGSTLASLMREDDDMPASVAMVKSNSGRSPASIPQESLLKKSLSHLVDMDLSCTGKKSVELKVVGSFVQLKGKNCLKNFKQDQMQIINQSNGFTASFFEYGTGLYQTDLIQLKEGENQITIRYTPPGGRAIEQVLNVQSSSI